MMRKLLYNILFIIYPTTFIVNSTSAQEQKSSVSIAAEFVKSMPLTNLSDSVKSVGKVSGYMLQGLDRIWVKTANGIYFNFIQKCVDTYLNKTLSALKTDSLDMEGLEYGKSLLMLYKVTGQKKYFEAASALWSRLDNEKISGRNNFETVVCFFAEYADLVNDKAGFNSIARSFILRKAETFNIGLQLTAEQRFVQFGFAMVEALEYFPESKNKKMLLEVLNDWRDKVQTEAKQSQKFWSNLKPSIRYRYLYTLSKAVRLGYIGKEISPLLKSGYAAANSENGGLHSNALIPELNMEEKGLLLLAINERNLQPVNPSGPRVVLLDSYFNNETKIDQSGNTVRWHYKWSERGDNGFFMWGAQFKRAGYLTSTLYSKPNKSNLRNASVYIIVDPDTKKENKEPAYISSRDVKEISSWVKSGGILLLMANDSANTELDHLNKLAANFGVQFNKDSKGKVTDNQFNMGKISVDRNNIVFKTAREVFIKEFSSLNLSDSSQVVLKDKDGNSVVAAVSFGKGKVLFVGDPWLYNEYVDGRKLPSEYNNFGAGLDLIYWIYNQRTDMKLK